VTGAVGKPGCYEAPNGVTTRELVDEHAGGVTDEVGAVVPGGAASGILPPSALDAPLTRDGLREYGAGPGSAAVQVFPASYSPLRLLAETMRFFAEESCQKCTPCRIGNRALHHLSEELQRGEAAMTREKVDEWLLAMEKTSICGLGQASPFPVRGAMAHWPELFGPLEQGVA
jgi:NADH-quinone oxidoreductase subunit F